HGAADDLVGPGGNGATRQPGLLQARLPYVILGSERRNGWPRHRLTGRRASVTGGRVRAVNWGGGGAMLGNPLSWGLVAVRVAGLWSPGGPLSTAPAEAQSRTTISTDQRQYRVGESIRYCYTVARAGHVRIVEIQADGRRQTLVSGNDDGRGGCRTGNVTGP